MRVDVLEPDSLREHHDLGVVEQLADLLGGAVGTLVLGRHPRLRRLLDQLLADRVHAGVELGDGARALGTCTRLVGELGEQLVEGLHGGAQRIGFTVVALTVAVRATWDPDATMRLPNAVHESGPWRIREIVPDFTLEDVWALPVEGGPEDFQALLAIMAASDPAHAESLPARVLWRVRDRLGSRLGLGGTAAPIDSGSDDATGKLPI